MPKFRKKPVVIEAFKYTVVFTSWPNWFSDKVMIRDIVIFYDHCEIKTLEGVMRGEIGDFIIQGVNGEVYPCKPDIFEKSYEAVEEEEKKQ